jgi:hypothetical protein
VDEAKTTLCQLPSEPGRVDKRKVALKCLHRRKFTRTDLLLLFTGQLEDYRECAARVNQRKGVLKAVIDSGVFEDQRGVDQLQRIKFNPLRS